jgi:hypothetical protein
MLNGTNKTSFLITIIICSLACFIQLLGFKESLIKIIFFNQEEESLEDFQQNDFVIKEVKNKNGSSLLNDNSSTPVNYCALSETFGYFNFNVIKNYFKISYNFGNMINKIEEKNINLIGVVNNIKEANLYITYKENYSNDIKVMNLNYRNGNKNSATSISVMQIDKNLDLNKIQPVIVKNNKDSLVILTSDNKLHLNVLNRNYFFSENEIIKPQECIKYKIVEIESYLSDDQAYLILAFIYYCADLASIDLKYSNLIVKMEKKWKGTKVPSQFKQIYKINAKNYTDLYELNTSEYFTSKVKDLSNSITSNGNDIFLIKLKNEAILLQKFHYQDILEENYLNTYIFDYKVMRTSKGYKSSIDLNNSKIIFNNENLYFISKYVSKNKGNTSNIFLHKVNLVDNFSNGEIGKISKIKLNLNSDFNSLDIKELSDHILIKDKSPLSDLLLIQK